jgi:hypothetical protein
LVPRVALGLVLIAAGIGAYWFSRPQPIPPAIGVLRATEVRIAPEIAGQLATIKVHKGDYYRARKDRSPLSQRRVVETFAMPVLISLTFFAELGKLG